MRHYGALFCATLVFASCGDPATELTNSEPVSTTAKTNPGVVKEDHSGPVRVPSTATLLRVEHRDPYMWKAELSFTGPTAAVVREIATNLADELHFKMRPIIGDPIAECPDGGVLQPDGSGECKILGDRWAGGGNISVTVVRPLATGPGTITISRLFEHRMRGDRIGPPFPR